MNDVRRSVHLLQRQYSLYRPTLDDLVLVASELGYEVIDFDPKNESVAMLVGRLSLSDSVLAQSAFVYSNNDVKLVFLRYDLSVTEKLLALAHEIGHIVLGHVSTTGRATVLEEYEAHEFTHLLLYPATTIRISVFLQRHRVGGLVVLLLFVLVILSVGYMIRSNRYANYGGEFYITPNGTKYHRAACSIIKERSNARRMTKDEYESGQYKPCSLCVPEE